MAALMAVSGYGLQAMDQPDGARLLRFPSTNGKEVVFTYAGDLYTAPLAGGEAHRLTSHEGYEMFPVSPPTDATSPSLKPLRRQHRSVSDAVGRRHP